MKKFWKDFKEFISRGNIMDLAVAVVVGGAFGKIVTSLVNNIIMPLISLATGGASVEDWKWVIKPADPITGTAESALSYGIFIQSIIDFLIISFFIFLVIRILQRSRTKLDEVGKNLQKEIKKSRRGKKGKSESTVIEAADTTEEETIAETTVEKTPTEAPAATETQEELLREIRDLLKSKQQ